MLKSKVVRGLLALILVFAFGGFYGAYTEAKQEIEILTYELEERKLRLKRVEEELAKLPELSEQVEVAEGELERLYQERDRRFEKLKKEKAVW